MKRLILAMNIAVCYVGYAQTKIDYTNFNYALLERMVIEEINEYRISIGLKELYTSIVLRNSYSMVTASLNAREDGIFNTKFNLADDTLARKLYNDFGTLQKVIVQKKDQWDDLLSRN